MNLETLEDEIISWGEERGILPDVNPVAQFKKTMEEVQELSIGIDAKNIDEIRDAIGDIFVTLVMQTQAWELTMQECVEQAWNDIKDRKGEMVDGVFVKDGVQ